MLFYWNSSLETGNAEIDLQHRRLFDLTNELARQVGTGGRLPDVADLVANLRDYAARHFCDEEKIMACSRLTATEQDRHVCAHRSFIAKVDEIAGRTDLGAAEAVEQFLEFLVTWLVMHILRMDRRIVRSLSGTLDDGDDTTVERALIKALNETERRFRMISDDAPAMIWIAGGSGARDYANRAWYEYVGAGRKPASEIDWDGFVHPEDRASYQALVADVVAHPRRVETELRVRRPDGSWGWIIERILPRIEGVRCVGLVAAASDVTLIKRSEEMLAQTNQRLEREVAHRTAQLQRMALTDPLTGTGNRRAAFATLAAFADECRTGGRALSLLYIDVDHFKRVNDDHGHAVGDAALMAVAAALVAEFASDRVVYRIGGEEFIAVLPDWDVEAAVAGAERLRRAVAGLAIAPADLRLTVSVGVAGLLPGESGEALVNRADDALRRAKQDGRDRVCRWRPEMALPA